MSSQIQLTHNFPSTCNKLCCFGIVPVIKKVFWNKRKFFLCMITCDYHDYVDKCVHKRHGKVIRKSCHCPPPCSTWQKAMSDWSHLWLRIWNLAKSAPSHQQMLTYYLSVVPAFTWEQFRKRHSCYQSVSLKITLPGANESNTIKIYNYNVYPEWNWSLWPALAMNSLWLSDDRPWATLFTWWLVAIR